MVEIIITSSVLILVLILFRKLCWGKISRRLQYGLWLLVVIRLLIPAQFFTSSLSIMNLVEYAQETDSFRGEEEKNSDTSRLENIKEENLDQTVPNISEDRENHYIVDEQPGNSQETSQNTPWKKIMLTSP